MAVWSVIKQSQVLIDKRIDADFFSPDALNVEKSILSCTNSKLRSLSSGITDFGAYSQMNFVEYQSVGYARFVRNQDVKSFFLDYTDSIMVNKETYSKLSLQLEVRDILIQRTGTVGKAAIVVSKDLPATANQNLAQIKVNESKLNPFYLITYFNTTYGRKSFERLQTGNVQPWLNLHQVGNLRIPVFDDSIQKEIEKTAIEGIEAYSISQFLYAQAQQILESELGLNKLVFRKPMGYAACFSELEQSFRSDAQHYQPRFIQLIDHLAAFQPVRVRDIRIYNRRGLQPVYIKNDTIDVVNSQHLGIRHIDYDNLQKTSLTAFNKVPEGHVRNNDLLIYTTGAHVGRTNVYLSNKQALASNHVNILRLMSEIDAAYVSLVFQSIIGQFQTQKHARGSAQAELYPTDIDRFIIPLLEPAKQEAIGDLIRESLKREQESKRLLEQAKTRVEQLIEEAVKS